MDADSVELIVRAAPRRARSTPSGLDGFGDAAAAEAVVLALADTQLDRVADGEFDSTRAEALDLLRRHLMAGPDAISDSTTVARPDHHGGLAFRLGSPIDLPYAEALAEMAREFRGSPRFAAIMVEFSPWVGARTVPVRSPDTTLGDRLIVLDRRGRGLDDLRDTSRVCLGLRRAILARCPVQPVPEWIGGHHADGRRLQRDHLAIVALPAIDPAGRWRLFGAGLLVPRGVSEAEIDHQLRPALRPSHPNGPLRLWDDSSPPIGWTLHPRSGGVHREQQLESWWRAGNLGATAWASMTPVVLDRHGSSTREQQDAIARSCERLGLPRPSSIDVGPRALVPGVPVAGSFPMSRRAGRQTRQQWHVRVIFPRPVRGPIVLGAGRYRGYGLLMPLDSPSIERSLDEA